MLRQATQRRLVIPAKPVNSCLWYIINRPTVVPTVEAGGQCQRHVLPVMETDPSAAGVKQRGIVRLLSEVLLNTDLQAATQTHCGHICRNHRI